MINLRSLATNVIKTNKSTFSFVRKQLKQEQIWCGQRAAHSSFTAGLLIRNRTTDHAQTDYLFPSSGRSKDESSRQHGMLLSHQLMWCARSSNSLLACYGQTRGFGTKRCDQANKSDTKAAAAVTDANHDLFGDASKLGLFAKFKLMYKMYWYVLIPVHVVTSAGWLGGFYYLSQSGVDVPSLLQYLHLSETIIRTVQESNLGHWAVAYLCYKVATPLRYAVTLGGTTVSIKYLVQQGYIKPMPTKAEFIQMYEDKKAQRAADKATKDKTSSNQHEQPHEQK